MLLQLWGVGDWSEKRCKSEWRRKFSIHPNSITFHDNKHGGKSPEVKITSALRGAGTVQRWRTLSWSSIRRLNTVLFFPCTSIIICCTIKKKKVFFQLKCCTALRVISMLTTSHPRIQGVTKSHMNTDFFSKSQSSHCLRSHWNLGDSSSFSCKLPNL